MTHDRRGTAHRSPVHRVESGGGGVLVNAGPMRSSIAAVRGDEISIRGRDLVAELMGHVSFTHLVFLLVAGRAPERREEAMLDACLVALAEHGLTLSATVARATSTTAPESLQGAVAAGLLGVGDRVAGSMEGCGRTLHALAAECASGRDRGEAVADHVARTLARRARIAGFGHTQHAGGDPRANRLLALAREERVAAEHVELLDALAAEIGRQTGRALPVNVTGAIAAVLMDVGFEWSILRGFALVSRCAGLVAHIHEERSEPLVPALRRLLLDASTGDDADSRVT